MIDTSSLRRKTLLFNLTFTCWKNSKFRCKNQLATEECRHRDLIARINRSTRLSIDNYDTKLQNIEEVNESFRSEVDKYKSILTTVQNEKTLSGHRLSLEWIEDLQSGVRAEKIKTKSEGQLSWSHLKHQNIYFEDSFDELQASTVSKSVKKGKNVPTKTKSLEAEFDESVHYDHNSTSSLRINKLVTALKHQQEANN